MMEKDITRYANYFKGYTELLDVFCYKKTIYLYGGTTWRIYQMNL